MAQVGTCAINRNANRYLCDSRLSYHPQPFLVSRLSRPHWKNLLCRYFSFPGLTGSLIGCVSLCSPVHPSIIIIARGGKNNKNKYIYICLYKKNMLSIKKLNQDKPRLSNTCMFYSIKICLINWQ